MRNPCTLNMATTPSASAEDRSHGRDQARWHVAVKD
jgi:hypothetical protein